MVKIKVKMIKKMMMKLKQTKIYLTWPMSSIGESLATLHVQYRDLAGNISKAYSDTYTVEVTTGAKLDQASVRPCWRTMAASSGASG